ncbi:visual pigment-like receptor peropsin [Polyodon spathula]|uniref:visual pigment-like receptor peropsin n=1 Tax=Polyodon spathula TaxID=7913 RepID=UPI001B7F61ED|nr:visual pigment-like receptor peropsin [Polyodon spathula]
MENISRILVTKLAEDESSNSSDRGDEYQGHSVFSQTEHNIVATYLITAGVVSLLSNILVLAMFVKFKELRTATNVIIINLAFTDIGISGIGYPMSAASDLHGSWKFGYTGCQIYAALNIFFGMASIGLLTVVATRTGDENIRLDYIHSFIPIPNLCRDSLFNAPPFFLTGRNMTNRTYALLIGAAWVNALFWSTMPVIGWASYAADPTGATCTVNWRKNDLSFVSYTMSVISVNFIVPLSVMFYCYYNVSQTMKRYTNSNCLENIDMDWSDQLDVTKMSIVMIVMFLVAWLPYSVVCLWASFGNPQQIPAPMAIIAPLFAKSSTFYNPCIYVIANKNSLMLEYHEADNTWTPEE